MVEPDEKELSRLEDEIFQAACTLMMHDPCGAFRVARAVAQAQESLIAPIETAAFEPAPEPDPIPAGWEPRPDGTIIH